MRIAMRNYWSRRIKFKEKIAKKLYPILFKKYVGKQATGSALSQIQKDVFDYVVNDVDSCDHCDVKVDTEKRKTQDGKEIKIIKDIRIIPVF